MDRNILNATLEEVLETTSDAPLPSAQLPIGTLSDEEPKIQNVTDVSGSSSNEETTETTLEKPQPPKRFIPEHKKPDAALTFPEKVRSK